MLNIMEQIENKGYSVVNLDLTVEDRREFARLGNLVIDIALNNTDVYRSLNFSPRPNTPGHDTTAFAVSEPRVSKDNSLWFHSGWQTKNHVETVLPINKQPKELIDFLDIQRHVLETISSSWLDFLEEIVLSETSGNDVDELIVNEDLMLNNHHLRIVRYRQLSKYTKDNGTFSAHGDLGTLTTQFFQTHDGHLRIAPYPLSMVEDAVTEKRYNHARSMHDIAETVEYNLDTEAVTFLGFGAANVRDLAGKPIFQEMNAGYHFGIPPELNTPNDENIESDFGEDVRIATVAFGHPHYLTPYTQYRTTTKEACRPEQVYEGNTK
jgi:hypothetical protein